jgi:transposase
MVTSTTCANALSISTTTSTERYVVRELWYEKAKILTSVPGVGPGRCAALLARLPELGRLNRAQAAKLVGVAPLNHDSGKFRGIRLISGGRVDLRRVLYMNALIGMRVTTQSLRLTILRLRAKGEVGKVALVATMRKLLLVLNLMIRNRTLWSPRCLDA